MWWKPSFCMIFKENRALTCMRILTCEKLHHQSKKFSKSELWNAQRLRFFNFQRLHHSWKNFLKNKSSEMHKNEGFHMSKTSPWFKIFPKRALWNANKKRFHMSKTWPWLKKILKTSALKCTEMKVFHKSQISAW